MTIVIIAGYGFTDRESLVDADDEDHTSKKWDGSTPPSVHGIVEACTLGSTGETRPNLREWSTIVAFVVHNIAPDDEQCVQSKSDSCN